MSPPSKKHKLSIVSSNKVRTKGHRDRLEFCKRLANDLNCEDHFFGRGIKDFKDKWVTLKEYEYTIAIENSQEEHWITEKLTDPFIAYTFPFYFGAPNVGNYYPKNSFQKIDINDYEKSKKVICNIINCNTFYSEHLTSLTLARKTFFDRFVFPRHIENFKKNTKCRADLVDPVLIKKDPGLSKANGALRRFKSYLNW
jgi:hypothetical protein